MFLTMRPLGVPVSIPVRFITNKIFACHSERSEESNELDASLRSSVSTQAKSFTKVSMSSANQSLIDQTITCLRQELASPAYPPDLPEKLLQDAKLLFARLVFLIGEALDHPQPTDLVPLASASQLMYAALAIVDDVADGDKVESLAAQYGTATALFSGLNIWVGAQKTILNLIEESRAKIQIPVRQATDLLHDAMRGTLEAHLEDSLSAKIICDENSYLERAARRSGLFSQMIFQLTATLGGASAEPIARLGKIGYLMGVLMQVKNDLQSCYAPVSSRNSLDCRLISLPVAFICNEEREPYAGHFKQLWYTENKTTNEDRQVLLNLLEESGAIEYTRFLLFYYLNQVKSYIQSDVPAEREISKYIQAWVV
jgi:geranylgeranyl pyrophosphate synthase